jgi:PD-(D/E)XK nuclease superfamily
MKISHSAKNMYVECARKYKYHYIDRLRPNRQFSALFFGSALDEAFSALLLQKKKVLLDEEKALLELGAVPAFLAKMANPQLNGEDFDVAKSPKVEYYKSDFDADLITKDDLEHFAGEFPELKGSFLLFRDKCSERIGKKSAISVLKEEDLVIYNYMTWYSLVKKGKLMIEAYEQQIMPQIAEVFSVQKRIAIESEQGDVIGGLIDFTASFVDDPSSVYVCDNKTSSKKYEANSVAESDQLATYCEAENTNKAAYVVIEKKLYKKAPIIHTQIVKDTISEEKFVTTLESFADTIDNVIAGKFPKNEDACFAYGKLCPFAGICKYNKSVEESGLINIDELRKPDGT